MSRLKRLSRKYRPCRLGDRNPQQPISIGGRLRRMATHPAVPVAMRPHARGAARSLRMGRHPFTRTKLGIQCVLAYVFETTLPCAGGYWIIRFRRRLRTRGVLKDLRHIRVCRFAMSPPHDPHHR
jgi:hypothetical protein